MQEVKKDKTKQYKGSIVLKISLLCLAAYFIFTLISQQISISEKKQELELKNNQIKTQQTNNDELQYQIDEEASGDKKYAEEYARSELGYAKQGERVFVNIGGN